MARRQRGHIDLSVAAQRTWRWNWVKQDRETTGEGRKGQAQSTHLYTGYMSGTRGWGQDQASRAETERRLKGQTGGTAWQGLVGLQPRQM